MDDTYYHPPVRHTAKGTPYLTEPGYVLMGMTALVDSLLLNLSGFLSGFDSELGFSDYIGEDPGELSDGERLCKIAGQLCYLSFGPGRTKNVDALKYFYNILESGHGSVIEHLNFTFLFYGISRSLTHELVRHRAGMAYSQVSQRYVDGSKLRFVMRPEFAGDPNLIELFEQHIDQAAMDYDQLATYLLDKRHRQGVTGTKTELRKGVNQVARSVLPNDTEAPIMVTGNTRAIRHFLNMRGGLAAETEIRRIAVPTARIMRAEAKHIFQDVSVDNYHFLHGEEVGLPDTVKLQFPKV